MQAMLFKGQKAPLTYEDVSKPQPLADEVLVEVIACGVCRTDLHVVDGELAKPKLPLIPGHEIVGRVIETGGKVSGLQKGQLVGVPWLARTCGHCRFCQAGEENLCDNAIFTGYTKDGGYAEYVCASEHFCFPIPDGYDPSAAAPLLCAGLIGWRSYKMAGNAKTIGVYGFGGAAHILTQVATYDKKEIYAFTRGGDKKAQDFAKSVGAVWAGSSSDKPADLLDAAIIFAPVGPLVLDALKAIRKGGIVVCGGIHMSDIPPIAYDLLWGERSIKSVANLTRNDGVEFMKKITEHHIKTTVQHYDLKDANQALDDLRSGQFSGAAVLKIKA